MHDILHGVGILIWRKYCTDDYVTLTVTGGFATFTISGSYAALLLLAALLRFWCASWVGRFLSLHDVLVGTGGVLAGFGWDA
ncbi:hypothetical protein F383_09569 [Gossypium arboreum]|uniref:Uncharacterized protein n=1 Tax=Gossypium arboreum TaxID=29729 RepID=A0A0B0NBV4_GOSAR|nr:hypothetical protein F383_09569 [Gossypium arboreum]